MNSDKNIDLFVDNNMDLFSDKNSTYYRMDNGEYIKWDKNKKCYYLLKNNEWVLDSIVFEWIYGSEHTYGDVFKEGEEKTL